MSRMSCTTRELRGDLATWLNRAGFGGNRICIARNGQFVAVLVSFEDLCTLEEHDDAVARQALEEREAALRSLGFPVPPRLAEVELEPLRAEAPARSPFSEALGFSEPIPGVTPGWTNEKEVAWRAWEARMRSGTHRTPEGA